VTEQCCSFVSVCIA